MLGISTDDVRLFLHVLAATVWVGGQLVLAALVPVLRSTSAAAPRAAARRFGQVAWPAFLVLLGTGAWNVAAEHDKVHGRYLVTLIVKLSFVLLSGIAAWAHTRARRPRMVAVSGAAAGLTALAALLLGVMLADA
jgi:putative copper export protein